MKDNISSSQIYNRKIILELRYAPIPSLLDCKGTIANNIIKSGIILDTAWLIDHDSIKITNNLNEAMASIHAHIAYDKLYLVYYNPDSIETYWNLYRKLFEIFQKQFQSFDIYRIGCRIIGTYPTKSNNYPDLIENYKTIFPSNIILDEFPVKDMQFTMEYTNGRYIVGPIKEKDLFVINNFPNIDTRRDKIGFGIDTDNFIIREEGKPIKVDPSSTNTVLNQIQTVLTASLSVETLLFDKLHNL